MRRPAVFIGAFVIGILALIIYFQQQPPAGVEPMGDESPMRQWLTLAIGIVSLLTALVGLIQKVIELRAHKRA